MWFLIKAAFWFSLVLILLPIFGPQDAGAPATAPKVNVGETVSAASEAFGYFSAICMEKPDVCVKGGETFTALGHRAKAGARIAYQLLDSQFGDAGKAAPEGALTTGTVAAAPNSTAEEPSAEPAATVTRERQEPFTFTRIPVPEWRIAPSPRQPS